MRENSERSQASLEFLLMLVAVLVVVSGITLTIYISATGLGDDVEEKIDNTVSDVENLLKMTAVEFDVQGVSNA